MITKELKLSTKEGKRIYHMGCRYDGYDIYQVYNNPSHEKIIAFNRCYDEYLATEDRDSFSICSHNTFSFTVSWLGRINGENIMIVKTKDHRYILWLDR